MTSRNKRIGNSSKKQTPFTALWLASFTGYLAIGATIQVMPEYAHLRMGATPVEAGLAVTIGSFAAMVARPVAGWFADRRGARGAVLTGAVLSSLGGLGHLLARNIPELLAARLLLGAGEGMLFTAAVTWVLSVASRDQQGRIAGLFGLSMWGGLAGGPMLGALLLFISGYSAVWIVAAILPIVGSAIVLGVRSPKIVSSKSSTQNLLHTLLPPAAHRPAATFALSSFGYGVIGAFLVPRFTIEDFAGRSIALSLFGGAFLLVRFIGSPFVDRLGGRAVVLVSLALETGGLIGLALVQNAAVALILCAIVGSGVALLFPGLASITTHDAPMNQQGAAIGALTSAWDFGLALSGPIGGFVSGQNYTGAFLVAGMTSAIAAIPLSVMRTRS